MQTLPGLLCAGIFIFCLALLCPSAMVLGQQGKVFQSHPFDLDTEAASLAPFQLQPYETSQYLPCCSLFSLPGELNFFSTLIFGNQWAGIPYRQNLYVLDGSNTDSARSIYRAGSLYFRTTFINGESGI